MILARPAAIATHHVDLAESSIADALTTLHRVEADRYHPTRVYKVTLLGVGDEIEELVDWLDQPERKVRPDACIEALWDGQWQVSPSSSNSLPLPLPNSSSSPPRLPLRTFGLSFHRMNTKGYNAIARLVKRHGTLTTLDMVMGTGALLPSLRPLAQAISQSVLRKVILSSTPFSPGAFCDLIDSLDAPCLRELRLSLTMSATGITNEQSLTAAVSLAHLIRPVHSGIASRDGRQHGRAPQLELLTLNGNTFTLRGVRIIVAAATGGPYYPPNRSLTHLELFATSRPDDVDSEDEDRQHEDDTVPRRTLSIGRSYLERRKARASVRSDKDEGEDSEGTGAGPHYEFDLAPDDRRAYRHVTSENWRRKLGSHLWRNAQERSGVVWAAQEVLGKARLLGCRARLVPNSDANATSEPSVIERLPPELRLHILRFLDEDDCLSDRQFRLIISWACDPQTIGYGEPGWAKPWRHDDPALPPSQPTSSLLPSHPWSWREMFQERSLPRDWAAESWDEWNEAKDIFPLMSRSDVGGGGGPDGEGGATEGQDRPRHHHRRADAHASTEGVTTLQSQMSSINRRAPDPALMAFLEATGTRTPDVDLRTTSRA